MDDYATRRLAELRAAAPLKRKKQALFAKVDLEPAARAFVAMNCPKAFVYVWLLHRARVTNNRTVLASNSTLSKYGIGRGTKHRALTDLEAAGVVVVEWRSRKNPLVTLL
jgi:hypothetical protein